MLINQESKNSILEVTAGEKTIEVPTILTQTKAHHSRSPKYSVVNTGDIIKQFEDAGWTSKLYAKERPRKEEFKGFETHVYCLEHPDVVVKGMEGEMRPRLYLKNSYHGRSKLEYVFGLIRSYCLNGLVLGNIFESIKRRHVGIEPREIAEFATLMQTFFNDEVLPYILNLKKSVLTEQQMLAFAEIVLRERFRGNTDFVKGEHEKLLTVYREEDRENSPWNVLNRVQENLGLSYRKADVTLKYVFKTTDKDNNPIQKEREMRGLKNIREVTHMNRYLFDAMGQILNPQDQSVEKAA
jgi:hypothetical protein